MSAIGASTAVTRPLVLLTRPIDRAKPLAAELDALGIEALIWPVLDITPTLSTTPPLNDAQAVLMTSPRAVEALPTPIGDITSAPAFCVGGATAAAARNAGFSVVHDADGDAGDLATMVDACLSPTDGPLLYLRGLDVARDMTALLPGFTIRAVEVYQAATMTTPPANVKKALSAGNLAAVALFSPRAAATFASALTDEMQKGLVATTAVVMSDRVAIKLNQTAFQSVVVAERTTGNAMRAAICGACGVAVPQNGVCD